MARVAPSERFRAELDQALAGVGQEQDPVEAIGRLGARLILQQALEDEVSEFLGRARYSGPKSPSPTATATSPAGSGPPRARSASSARGCATLRSSASRVGCSAGT